MKKISLFILIISITSISFSQNLTADFAAHVDSSGVYLQKSASNLGFSMITGVLSGACVFWAQDIHKNGDTNEKATLQFVLAGGLAAVTVGFYISHIVNFSKSGKHLQEANRIYQQQQKVQLKFQTNQDGVGLALRF